MDLLDEIKNDPGFNTGETSNDNMINEIGLSLEALLLVLAAKGLVREDEYQLAISHIQDDVKYIVDNEIKVDAQYIADSNSRFKLKLESERKT